MISEKDIAICVLFFEKPEQTIECVRSFLSSNSNIYLLNNNSSQLSTNLLKKFIDNYPQIKLYSSNKNLGVSRGRNFLINKTKEKWLFFVDNDITIKTKNWVKLAINLIKQNPHVDAIIPKLFNKHENKFVLHLKTKIKGNSAVFEKVEINEQPNIFPGGASIVNRKVFSDIGLYDERMFVGLEDFELAIRALKMKRPFKSLITDEILLVHDHRSAKTTEDKNAILERYNHELIQHSFDILKQTHNLNLDNDWRPWVDQQIKLMTSSSNIFLKFKKFLSKNAR